MLNVFVLIPHVPEKVLPLELGNSHRAIFDPYGVWIDGELHSRMTFTEIDPM